jgi:hypothetical protein
MQYRKVEGHPPTSPPAPAARRPNWPLIMYEGIWDYFDELGDHPWTWRSALLLLTALAHLPH